MRPSDADDAPARASSRSEDSEMEYDGGVKGIASKTAKRIGGMVTKSRDTLRGNLRKRVSGSEEIPVRRVVQALLHSKPVIRSVDKASFVAGVTNMIVTCVLIAIAPHYFWAFYFAWMAPLLAARAFIYGRGKQHYYLRDFCYFVQVLSLTQVLAIPTDLSFFKAFFALSNGPLAWAIVLWRNSLVFHSLDKVTSIFIHAFPPLLSFCIRWFPDTEHRAVCTDDVLPLPHSRELSAPAPLGGTDPSGCSMDAWSGVGLPLLIYLGWQAIYCYTTYVADAEKLRRDPSIETSIRHLARKSSTGPARAVLMVMRRLHIMGPDEDFDAETSKTQAIFMSSQLAFTAATVAPAAYILYSSFAAHLGFLILIYLIAASNGANYYFEVFAKRYMEGVMKRTDDAAAEVAAAAEPKAHDE